MNQSEPDYDNPNVVRINSIAIGLVLCFFVTLGLVWLFGGGGKSVTAPIVDDPPTPTPEGIGLDKSTIMERLALANVARGSALYQRYGCANCHALDGSEGSATPLIGIRRNIPTSYESPESYLIDVILDPQSISRTTYTDAVMPSNYDELLTEQDVADLVVFILEQ